MLEINLAILYIILIFDFFIFFYYLSDSNIFQDVRGRFKAIRETSEIYGESITSWTDKSQQKNTGKRTRDFRR